ncbi:hypothetical protein [Flavobacterium sp.]|uniref:hypothetical protein n=2 Tax=Flavobacterium sp. TaxID=239 RepID=UPI0040488D75
MKKYFLLISLISTFTIFSQVGINTTNPTATLHVFGSTTPGSSGGTVNLINENFSSYTVTQNHTIDSDCTGNATQGWVTGTGNANVNCTSCTGTWLYISSDALSCGLNSTAIMNFSTAPTTTSISISFAYRYNNFGAAPDSFRAYLYNNTTSSQVGANFFNLTTDANTTYSGTATVVPGNSYSLRFEYIGDYDYGASVDNVLVTETASASPGSYSFRLEDGTQGVGKVLTSDADGNGYWQTPTGGGSGTDSQTLSIVGNDLTISNGNTVTLPSGGSGSYTFTNGLTLTGSTVRLGGTLTQGTTLNLDTNDLTFRSSTSAAFPGEMIIQGTDRVMMDTRFDDNYINFGSGAFIDGDDGTTFSDTGNSSYTKDFVAGFYNGSSGGTAIAIGSIEYIVDGTNEIFFKGSGFSPMTNFGADLGKGSPFQSGPIRNWDDVYARNFVASSGSTYNRISQRGNNFSKGLKEIMQLEPILYKEEAVNIGSRMSTEAERDEHIGFNVTNVLQVIPEAVKTSDWFVLKEGQDPVKMNIENPTGIMFNQIIPVVVKAMQEQQGEIEQLKKEIEELKLLIKEYKK